MARQFAPEQTICLALEDAVRQEGRVQGVHLIFGCGEGSGMGEASGGRDERPVGVDPHHRLGAELVAVELYLDLPEACHEELESLLAEAPRAVVHQPILVSVRVLGVQVAVLGLGQGVQRDDRHLVPKSDERRRGRLHTP